ncbi:nickel/cobalt efflux transporter [Roseospirillum parvum]|uniref:Nickel/cobalt efflux system n=1 Tax=Roseospirillum parvum TaxID=83401 RepID=A0A1G8BL62_9PROT|nr:nickel/cobalt efflux transporter [Roseospirillum parvum]SDH33946.1 nickel/cobalt exporter [Roseospirillum parvum]
MDLTAALAQGTASPLPLAATALLLGALHGLEPGHSKTMMAAFIIAVRGTPAQAVALGLSAALSHTLIVWVLALLALHFGQALIGENLEPWFMMASGVLVILIALWMLARLRRVARPAPHSHDHHHAHGHDHGHAHDHAHHHPDPPPGDAHAQAHAQEIEQRFAGQGRTTLTQTVLFGLSGGLIPCSAALTVLILCLHMDRFWLGVGLVGAFSAGLALTLVAAGLIAALAVRTVARRTRRLDTLMARAPYLSAALIGLIGLGMVVMGWQHLPAA